MYALLTKATEDGKPVGFTRINMEHVVEVYARQPWDGVTAIDCLDGRTRWVKESVEYVIGKGGDG
jgi:hypothetical protein